MFYDADEFNVSWLPTLRALWSPPGQQVMIPTPGQPYKRYGLGAVNYHTGETVVLFRRRKRRQEVTERLQALVTSIQRAPSMWPGIMRLPMPMMKSRPSSARQQGGWYCCPGRPTARGSTRLRCCGGSSAVK